MTTDDMNKMDTLCSLLGGEWEQHQGQVVWYNSYRMSATSVDSLLQAVNIALNKYRG